MRQRLLIPLILLVGVILGGALLVATDARAQQSWLELRNDVRIIGRIVATGDMVLDGDLHMTGDLAVDGAATSLPISVTSVVTVTNGGAEADCSNGGLIRIASSGNVGTGYIVTTTTNGVQCIVENTSNTTVTFTDTGWLRLAGNAALTQYDTLCLVSDNDGYWYQTCKNAN